MSKNSINSPLISVILPTYNGEKYLAETLESVLNQTYKNLEIIITDDCSTDRTVEIVKSYNDERIKLYVNEKNLGIANNTNKALSLATGEFIMMQDHDDVSSPFRAEGMLKVLLENKDLTGVCSRMFSFQTGISREEIDRNLNISEPITDLNEKQITVANLFVVNFFHPTIMYRSSILKSLDTPYTPDLKVTADSLLFTRFLGLKTKWYLLENQYVAYRFHKTNTSKIDRNVNYREDLIMIEHLIKATLPFVTKEDIDNHIIGRKHDKVLSYTGKTNKWIVDYYRRIIKYNIDNNVFDHEMLLKTLALHLKYFTNLSNVLRPLNSLKVYNSIDELKPYLESNLLVLWDWQERFFRAINWYFVGDRRLVNTKEISNN